MRNTTKQNLALLPMIVALVLASFLVTMYSLPQNVFCLHFLSSLWQKFFLIPKLIKTCNREKERGNHIPCCQVNFDWRDSFNSLFLYFYVQITFPLPLKEGFPSCYITPPPFWFYLLHIDSCFYKLLSRENVQKIKLSISYQEISIK